MKQATIVRDTLLPYALFIIGAAAAVPFYRVLRPAIITPIHEIGHVIAAFATGGYGAWDVGRWNEAITYGGSLFWIYISGVVFVVAVATAVPIALLRFKRWTAAGGALYTTGLIHAIEGHGQQDFHALRVNGFLEADLILDVMTVVMVVAIAIAIPFLLAQDLTKKRNPVYSN